MKCVRKNLFANNKMVQYVTDGNFTAVNVTGNLTLTGTMMNTGGGNLVGNLTGYVNGINLQVQDNIANAGNIIEADGAAADLTTTQQLQATVVAIQTALRAAGILLNDA